MSKRNFILLIIIIFILIGVLYYAFGNSTKPTNNSAPTVAEDTNFFSNIFPLFKKGNSDQNTNTETPTDISGYVPPANGEVRNMILYKVSSMPISGYGIFLKERYVEVPIKQNTEEETQIVRPTAPETEKVPALRYVDILNGNIYQTFVDKINESKITNTTVLSVHEALFSASGENVIMRYLKNDGKTIATFVGSLEREVLGADSLTTSELSGSFLSENITDLSILPQLSKIFYLFNNKNNTIGINADISGGKKSQVFDSAYSEWLSQYANQNTITLTTKASNAVAGYMYKINPNRKDFERVLGGINGLTTLTSPDGYQVLYGDGDMNLYLYNITTNTTKKISIKTLPEKCTWTEDGSEIYCAMPRNLTNNSYPDVWYMGEVSFSDQIWRINTESLNTGLVLDPLQTDGGEDIDGTHLKYNDGYLFFINKKDSYLWELKLN
ncbi:MAG: hypothetical protein M3P22_02740 [bacterium]|nr:hypothetical protein [bacterium]